jgi:hypothetical protein
MNQVTAHQQNKTCKVTQQGLCSLPAGVHVSPSPSWFHPLLAPTVQPYATEPEETYPRWQSAVHKAPPGRSKPKTHDSSNHTAPAGRFGRSRTWHPAITLQRKQRSWVALQ